MSVRRLFVEKRQGYFDVPAQQLCADLTETFRLTTELKAVRIFIRYDIEGLSDEEYKEVRDIVFVEPPVDTVYEETLPDFPESKTFAVEYLPGQYDQRADSAAQCVQLVTQKERPTIRTAVVYAIVGTISPALFAQIKAYCINRVESREAALKKPATLAEQIEEPADIETLAGFGRMDAASLAGLLKERGFAMSLEDLQLCQKYFATMEKRDPTITELRVIDTYWSDHCRHTTFTTVIDKVDFGNGKYAPMLAQALKLYTLDREKVYAAKKSDVSLMDLACIGMKALRQQGLLEDLDASDEVNACSIVVPVMIGEKEEKWLVMFKNETHNHPTEIEPFGGAATCLGGAIRDPLSGRAYVYQAMRVTGSADPRGKIADTLPGKLPQKKITQGAAAGFSSYGNQIGLATGQVLEFYHEGYMAKRMEIGAVIGAVPQVDVVRQTPEPGDVVVLVGGRTGRDGCGGATGSSKVHTEDSLKTAGAEVQKGNAPTERKIQRLFRHPEVSRFIKRCNDFGAGGVSVAVGELAPSLAIDLDAIKKKYEGLDGTELAISESQERMAVVMRPEALPVLMTFADRENLEATPIAKVTETGRLEMVWRGQKIVSIARAFLDTNGVKQHVRVHLQSPDVESNYLRQLPPAVVKNQSNLTAAWLANLADINVASQKGLSERFDSTVGAGTVLMPFGGKNQLSPQQGMVAKIPVKKGETDTATAMTFGFDPYLTEWSPFHGALYAIVEAVTKMVALGADAATVRLSLQEYFESLGKDPEKWGMPFAALLGALWAQHELRVPAIGGKDSMAGTFEQLHVPPTVVAFAVNVMKASEAISSEFKYANSKVYAIEVPIDANDLPVFANLRRNYERVHALMQSRRVFSAASVGRGGIAAALTKMCLGNELGFKAAPGAIKFEDLFRPAYGTILLEMSEAVNVTDALAGVKWTLLGRTTTVASIVCNGMVQTLDELREPYMAALDGIFPATAKSKGRTASAAAPFRRGVRQRATDRYAKPRIFMPVFPGINCEYETQRAFEKAGGEVDTLIVRNLTPQSVEETVRAITDGLNKAQILMLPGGFSGGDEPDGSGKFIAATLRNPRIAEAIMELLQKREGLILGICNGFQALVKLGLLPYGKIMPLDWEAPTLTHNTIGRHVSCMVQTRIMSNLSPWFNNVSVGDIHTIPVSHGEGRFVADKEVIAKMRIRGQIAAQYVDDAGEPTMESPFNPNGSTEAIEAITSPNGRILGKMGHSERVGENISKNVPGNKEQGLFDAGVRFFR